jgi:uncharacterized FlaG/YvyC family protein
LPRKAATATAPRSPPKTSSSRYRKWLIDRDSGDVIKQMPSEDLLKLINHMQEMQNILFDEIV